MVYDSESKLNEIIDVNTRKHMTGPVTYRAGKQHVAILPLAIVLLLHLVLALLWTSNASRHIDQEAEQRHFILAWLPAPKPRDPPPAVPPRAVKAAVRVARPIAAAAPQPAPSPAAEAVFDMPERSPATPASVPDALDVTQLIETAKRQAGVIDRELRRGKLAPLTQDADLPINRFRDALDSAYIDRSRTMVTESHTQSDGVIVYRFRRGSKVWCRQGGSSETGMSERSDGAKLAGAGSRGGAGAAGTITCPSGDAVWSRL